MKKILIMVTVVVTLLIHIDVEAKDTVYTINKYDKEELNYILKGHFQNKEDGYVSAGVYLKEDDENDDKQVFLIKYDKTGNVVWDYSYGKTAEDKLYSLSYSYNETNEVNGYTLVVSKTTDDEEEVIDDATFLMINEKGKLVKEKDLEIKGLKKITKLIESYDKETIDGYVVVGCVEREEKEIGIIAKYNLNYEKVWEKEYKPVATKTIVRDIISVKNENKEQEFIAIISMEIEEEKKYLLIRFDNNGDSKKEIKDDFESKDKPALLKLDENYFVYGQTSEVKLQDNETESFYITRYNKDDEVEWETIGDTSINPKKIIELKRVNEDYLLLYTNGSDSSVEIVKINNEGIIQDKIKKINNEYYKINTFLYDNETIYLVGQLKCPKDDKCDFKEKSLFLISDKDKVIEVKDNHSKIVIVVLVLLLSLFAFVALKKKKQK